MVERLIYKQYSKFLKQKYHFQNEFVASELTFKIFPLKYYFIWLQWPELALEIDLFLIIKYQGWKSL